MKRLAASCVILSLSLFLGCGDETRTKTGDKTTVKEKTTIRDGNKTTVKEKTTTKEGDKTTVEEKATVKEGAKTTVKEKTTDAEGAVRVILKTVKVAEKKADGKSWDVDDGKPDLVVSIKNLSDNTSKEVVTDEKKDTYEASFDSSTVLVSAGQRLRILVEDKDLAANDTIGETTIDVTADIIKKGTHTIKFGQVTELTIDFRKPSE